MCHEWLCGGHTLKHCLLSEVWNVTTHLINQIIICSLAAPILLKKTLRRKTINLAGEKIVRYPLCALTKSVGLGNVKFQPKIETWSPLSPPKWMGFSKWPWPPLKVKNCRLMKKKGKMVWVGSAIWRKNPLLTFGGFHIWRPHRRGRGQELRTNSIYFADREGEGVKNQNVVDVIYGSPLVLFFGQGLWPLPWIGRQFSPPLLLSSPLITGLRMTSPSAAEQRS